MFYLSLDRNPQADSKKCQFIIILSLFLDFNPNLPNSIIPTTIWTWVCWGEETFEQITALADGKIHSAEIWSVMNPNL